MLSHIRWLMLAVCWGCLPEHLHTACPCSCLVSSQCGGLVPRAVVPREQGAEVHEFLVTLSQSHIESLPLYVLGRGGHRGLPRFTGRRRRPHHPIEETSMLHSQKKKKGTWNGIYCSIHLWERQSATFVKIKNLIWI